MSDLPGWLAPVADDPAYGWAITQWRRAEAVPGAWFDVRKAQAAVDHWSKYFVLTEDRFAGVPFRLLVWQEIILRMMVGWKAPIDVVDPHTGLEVQEHVRLFQELRLWIARKNGKSEFMAALALYFFVLDGVYRGQGFAFARDEEQAAIVTDKMKEMIALSDALRSSVTPFAKSMFVPRSRSTFKLLPGVADGKHGKSATVIVGDEMHEWVSLEMKTTLRQSTGARLNPVALYASTAGLKEKIVGFGLFEESQAILDGRIEDPTTLVVIFAVPPDVAWDDETYWPLANPSLGLSPTMAFLRREAALAKDNPRAQAHFERYHLNRWVDSLVRWLNIARWDKCTADPTAWKRYPTELVGRKCYMAFDVSSTQDVTALLLLFPPVESGEGWKVVCRFWVPTETRERRVRDDRVPYDRFVEAGALETTDGDYVDQNAVMAAMLEALGQYEVIRIGFDPWNARKLVADMEREGVDPELFIEMRQGIQTLGEPTKEFERLVYAGQLDHGGHPMLRWMAGNAVVRFDENMNFAPAKKKSGEKIDGIVAGVMTIGLAFMGEEDRTSVYEERGLLEIEI